METLNFKNAVLVQIGEYRLRFHAQWHPEAGWVSGYQIEAIGAMGWCLLDDEQEQLEIIPKSTLEDFQAIVERFGRVW